MKVSKLITELKKLNPDYQVIIALNESAYRNLSAIGTELLWNSKGIETTVAVVVPGKKIQGV